MQHSAEPLVIPYLAFIEYQSEPPVITLRSGDGKNYRILLDHGSSALAMDSRIMQLSAIADDAVGLANIVVSGVPLDAYAKVFSPLKFLGDTGSGEKVLTWKVSHRTKISIFPDDSNKVLMATVSRSESKGIP